MRNTHSDLTHNMGGKSTHPAISFDWITLTWKDLPGLRDQILNDLARGKQWFEIGGALHYQRGVQFGHFKVYDIGNESICAVIDGAGCQQLASMKGLVSERDWQDWFARIIESGGRATRIDVCIDDRRGLVDVRTIVRKVERGHVKTQFKVEKTYSCKSPKTGSHKKSGVVFGKPSGGRSLLIYDKAFEQGLDEDWLRIEYRTYKSTARALTLAFAQDGFEAVLNDIRARVSFKVPPRSLQSEKSTWNDCRWWIKAVGKHSAKISPSKHERREEVPVEQIRQLRSLLCRIYEAQGEEGLISLWVACAMLADDSLKEAVIGFLPQTRAGIWNRHLRIKQARVAAEAEDARVMDFPKFSFGREEI